MIGSSRAMSRDTVDWLMPSSSPITSCGRLFLKYITVTLTATGSGTHRRRLRGRCHTPTASFTFSQSTANCWTVRPVVRWDGNGSPGGRNSVVGTSFFRLSRHRCGSIPELLTW